MSDYTVERRELSVHADRISDIAHQWHSRVFGEITSIGLSADAFTLFGTPASREHSNCVADTLGYIGQVEDLLNKAVATLHFAVSTYGEAEDKTREALKELQTPNTDTSGPRGIQRMLGLGG